MKGSVRFLAKSTIRLQKVKKMKKLLLLMCVGTLLLCSCGSVKDFRYFQDTAAGDVNQVPSAIQALKIKPYDKLSIIVTCKDPEMAAMYNLMATTNRVGQSSRTSSTGYGYISYYTVDMQGDVDMPILGKVRVAGLTRSEIAEKVKLRLITAEQGVKDATVTVEYADLHVGVLGEVKNTGIIPIDRDQFTILDAIERAGDLTQYGNRKNVKVFRKNGDTMQTYEVDMTNFKALCASPVYLMQQDDVIYVEPNDVRARQSTASGNTLLTPAFWMSALSVGLSIAVFLKK